MRKKKNEMTAVELVDQALKGRTWEEAEEAGVEILARCVALRIYARKEGSEYFSSLMRRVLDRSTEWAHENHSALAMAALGQKMKDNLAKLRKEAGDGK